MVRALVLLELHFYKDQDGRYWSKRIIDYHYLTRYLKSFDTIQVCARVSTISDTAGLLPLSGDNVTFAELPDTQGVKETLRNAGKLRKAFKHALSDIDCVVVRAPTILTYLFYDMIKRSNLPYSIDVTLSGTNMIPGNTRIINFANGLIDRRLKSMCKHANGVSYVTKEILQKAYPCQALLHSESLEYFTSYFSSLELTNHDYFQQHWDVQNTPSSFTIVHTGYMDDDRKCQDYLIKAISIVVKQGYDVHLKLIGDGARRTEYEQLAEKLGIRSRVIFTGLIKEKSQLFHELRDSQLFVLPTKAEGLPRAVLEAMAQGLPCISSPVDGVPELLQDADLVNWWDVNKMAERIVDKISNWAEMISDSQRNYEKAQEYRNDVLQSRRTEFYKQLSQLAENRKK